MLGGVKPPQLKCAMPNPFASPTANDSPDFPTSELSGRRLRYLQVGEAFVGWEKMRILYNLILATVALILVLVVDPKLLLDVDALEKMAMAAVGANVCFFAGHLVDCYATWLFGPLPWLRPLVFFVGTLGSLLLVLFVVLALAGGGFLAFLPNP